MNSAGPSLSDQRWDLVVVGAGIVGLAHAVEATQRGLRVVVIERDERAVGASIRNFGHACITAQTGVALDYALVTRIAWMRLAREAGFWLRPSGTVVIARTDDEYAVLEEFAAARDGQVELLDPAQVANRIPTRADLVGGAWFKLDLRLDPREAVPAIAAWLSQNRGVEFHWRTTVQAVEPGLVRTSRGDLRADRVVVAVGHDVDRLFRQVADTWSLQRCALHMLQIDSPVARVIAPAVLSGLSLLRYNGFRECAGLPSLRERIRRERPDLISADVNLMFTQRPDGDLVIGDTHVRALTTDPFRDEATDDLILAEIADLLGLTDPADLTVRRRWQGVYAWSPSTDFLLAAAHDDSIRIASVTSGIGMTTAFGFARAVLNDLAL